MIIPDQWFRPRVNHINSSTNLYVFPSSAELVQRAINRVYRDKEDEPTHAKRLSQALHALPKSQHPHIDVFLSPERTHTG